MPIIFMYTSIMYKTTHYNFRQITTYRVASSVGISEIKYRILILTVGCFFAGLAGGVFTHYSQIIDITNFNLSAVLWLWIYAWIGGITSFAGPIIGTSLLLIPGNITTTSAVCSLCFSCYLGRGCLFYAQGYSRLA